MFKRDLFRTAQYYLNKYYPKNSNNIFAIHSLSGIIATYFIFLAEITIECPNQHGTEKLSPNSTNMTVICLLVYLVMIASGYEQPIHHFLDYKTTRGCLDLSRFFQFLHVAARQQTFQVQLLYKFLMADKLRQNLLSMHSPLLSKNLPVRILRSNFNALSKFLTGFRGITVGQVPKLYYNYQPEGRPSSTQQNVEGDFHARIVIMLEFSSLNASIPIIQ